MHILTKASIADKNIMENITPNPNEEKIIIQDDFTMFPGTAGEVAPDVKIPKSFYIIESIGFVFFIISLLWTISNVAVQCDTPVCSLNNVIMITISGFGIFIGAVVMLSGFWMLSRSRNKEPENPAALIDSLQRIEAEAKAEHFEEETPKTETEES